MRKLTECVMEQLLWQYERVIYAAMKEVHVYKSSQDFDDYFQLGCLKLFEAYESCEKDPLLEENRYQFVNYAGQRMKWAFLDERRREQYLAEREEFLEDGVDDTVEPSFAEDFALQELLDQLLEKLTEKEKDFLYDRLYLEMTMTGIAKKRGVSRKTVHVWRKKIQEKVMQ